MTAIKKLIDSAAALCGVSIVPQWRQPGQALADHLRKLFAVYEVGVVLDVGANRGQYRDFLRFEVGYTGRIVSFEPLPALAAELTARAVEDPAWQVFGHALGDSDSELTIHITRDSKFSSFLAPTTQYTDTFARGQEVVQELPVRVSRLDTIGQGLIGDERANVYLKLDTQGHDLNVLRGGRELLSRVVAVQSEISFVPVYQGMAGLDATLSEFRGLGLVVSSLHPVSHDKAMRLVEADCVLLNVSHPSVATKLNGGGIVRKT